MATGVVFGKSNAEKLTDEELRVLLTSLVESGFCSVSDFRATCDCLFISEIFGKSRSGEEQEIADAREEQDSTLSKLRFESVDEVVQHLRSYPHAMVNIEQKLYDWTTREGEYGYRLVPAVGTLNRQFLESLIDAAMVGYKAIGWENAPFPDIWTFSVTYFGLDVTIERCPPDMRHPLLSLSKFEAPSAFLGKALGPGYEIHTMGVA